MVISLLIFLIFHVVIDFADMFQVMSWDPPIDEVIHIIASASIFRRDEVDVKPP
jgi:hypothetical protein